MEKGQTVYIVDLELSLKDADFIFGSVNISHIPYERLMDVFKDQTKNQRFLFDDSIGYVIDEELYNQNKEFFHDQIDFTFDFTLFDYAINLYSSDINTIGKSYHTELPPNF